MRDRLLAVSLVVGVAVVIVACSGRSAPTQPSQLTAPVRITTSGTDATVSDNHGTHLTGDAERPVPTGSQGQGQAIFQVNEDRTEIRFKLNVANIENVTQAHIHCCGGVDATAGIVVWLYPSAPPAQLIPGRSQGPLAEGTITQSSLVGGLAGQSVTVLLDRIASGLAYVNVHTSQFPPGEIRGQIR